MIERSPIEFDLSPELNPANVLKSVTSIPCDVRSCIIRLVIASKKDSDPEKNSKSCILKYLDYADVNRRIEL